MHETGRQLVGGGRSLCRARSACGCTHRKACSRPGCSTAVHAASTRAQRAIGELVDRRVTGTSAERQRGWDCLPVVAGLLLAVLASVLFNAAIVVQAMEAREVPSEHGLRLSLLACLVRRRRWLGGV